MEPERDKMLLNRRRHSFFYGWWIVASCFMIALYAGGAVYYGFTAIFEPIAHEFSWSYAQISLAASIRGLEVSLLAPLLGLLVDRWGPKRLMFWGTIIAGIGLIFLSRINSLGMFYVAFILIAIGISPTGATVTMTAVANWFRRKVAIAVGIATSGFAIGGLLVPLETVLIDTYGWRNVMVGLGLGMWAIAVPLSLLLRHKPEQYGYLPDGDTNDAAAIGAVPASSPGHEVPISIRHALRRSAFWHIALSFMLQMLVTSAALIHVMPYLSSIGIARSTSSMVAAVLPVASIFGRLGFGWLGDKLNKKAVTFVAFFLMIIALICFNYIATIGMWLLAPFLILFGIGWGGSVPMRVGLMRDYFGRSRFGTILGLATGIIMAGSIMGAPIAGWVFDNWGSYQGAWLVFAGLSIISVLLIATLPPLATSTRLPDPQ